MTAVESAVLGAHILAGFLALFAGIGAFVTRKGGRRHRLSGRTYVFAMAFVSGSALVLFVLDATVIRQFLALVAVFSFYFAFSGYRVLSRKRPADDPGVVDWVGVGLFGAASVGLLAMGGVWYLDGDGFAPVILVFGGIGTVFAVRDLRLFRAESEPGAWVEEHITRMGAGYIATVSAFSSVNFTFLPTVARWLWPTVLGTPLVFLLVRRYGPDRLSRSGPGG
jgi:uncharacterized membrane protein